MMAAIFRMEHTHKTDEIKQATRASGHTVANSAHRQTIDRAVMTWMRYRLGHKMPGLVMPDVDDRLKGTDMIETNMERIRANLIAEGVLLGRQEGRQERESMLLERQLAKRFGPLADATRTRLKNATAEQLVTWAERILVAQSLTQVFGEH